MLQPGDVLQGRYLIERLIGSGGMGSVYLARQSMLANRECALKEINFDAFHDEEREAALDQFKREAQVLATLRHPNLVDVKDCFEEQGRVYLIMDYVQGQNLEELLAAHPDQPVPYEVLQDWTEQLCEVLEYLHSRTPPIIFRDLKPANVMLDANGILHLIDFGIARVLDTGSMDLAEMQGTPGYAPIEQIQMAGIPPDARTDIYALGATLFNLMTRQHPGIFWDDSEETQVVMQSLPPALAGVIGKMMELRPDNRYRTVADARTALYKAFTEPMKATTTTRRVSLDQSVPTRRTGLDDPNQSGRHRPTITLARPRTGQLEDPASRPATGRTAGTPPPPVRRSETNRLAPPSGPTDRSPTPPPTAWGAAQPSVTRINPATAQIRTPATGGIASGYIPDVFGRKMELVLTHWNQNKLTFHCPKKPRLGFPLKAFFSDGNRPPAEVTLSLSDTLRTDEGIQYEVVVVNMPAYLLPLLAAQFSPKEAPRQEQRRLPRLAIAFQVTSMDLPGYTAQAVDLSLLGIRLHLSQPVSVGRTLSIDLDLGDGTNVKVSAQVRWCQPDARRGFQAGFKFSALNREAVMALDAFMQRAPKSPPVPT